MRLAKYFSLGLRRRIFLFFLTSTLLSVFIISSIGYVKIYEVTSNNSLIRIHRAASTSVALFSTRFQSEFMTSKLEGNNNEVIFLKGDTADISLSFRSDYDAVLKEIGAINQGAANLFKYNSESKAFDRFATTFRKPDGSMPPPMSIGLGHPAYDNIINGREHMGEVPVMGRLRLAHLAPILALDQSVLGILAVDVGWVDDLIESRYELRNQSFLIMSLIFILQSVFGIFYLSRETLPVRVLTKYAIDLANREKIGHIPYTDKHDEIGALAKGLARVSVLQDKLTDEKKFNELLLDKSSAVILTQDETWKILTCSTSWMSTFGYSREETIGTDLTRYMPPLDAAKSRSFRKNKVKKLKATGTIKNTLNFLTKSGSERVVELHSVITKLDKKWINVITLIDITDQTMMIDLLTKEITDRKHTVDLLRESEAILSATIDTALDAVIHINSKGFVTKWSNKAMEMFGWLQAEAIGQDMSKMIVPLQYREAHRNGIKHFLATGEGPVLKQRIEIMALHRDGHEFPIELSIAPLKVANEYEFTAFIRNISEAKTAEAKISKLAFYDDLTGLANRRTFYDKLRDSIKKSDSSSLPVAVMLLDLDRFKEVNDKLGHAQGDLLLVEAARRITACVCETDTVARLGGDEFTIILSEMKDVHSAGLIAQNIIESLAAPFHLLEEEIFVSASLGITFYPNDTQSIAGLFTNADQAMYLAKSSGSNGFCYFTAALQGAAQARLRLISDLRTALSGKQFAVHYQPIVELTTGKVYKVEALLRWQHPERGLVSPVEFIPVAEESGLIHEIGDWVFHEAIRDVGHWREMFTPELQVSVNVSPVQFQKSQRNDHGTSEGFKKNWLNALSRHGLPGESVIFEITEGVLLNETAPVSVTFDAIRDAGIQVALDDFGTGYSSLSYLKKFHIDYLKIDKSFVRNLENDSNDQALCEAIIIMAHKLGLKVIAEGVETEQQRDLLVCFGCDYAQGWLYSKAIPADEFEALLKEQG